MAKIIEAHRRHGRYISPAVDSVARIVFALLGGIFLLAPMVALSYCERKLYLVIITVLFTLFVSVVLGLVSRASNQELLAVTAAYAAVLTVFVGNAVNLQNNA
jgi:VIT1/CCC1 family predicted Fe2+/Mn2+ transporter